MASPPPPPPSDPITELLTTYNELNPPTIPSLTTDPSALEFMRFVHLNRPFVIRRGASGWKATRTWNVSVLKSLLQGQHVTVAVTPKGYVWFRSR
jgi:jumonji domain-containing protein 7